MQHLKLCSLHFCTGLFLSTSPENTFERTFEHVYTLARLPDHSSSHSLRVHRERRKLHCFIHLLLAAQVHRRNSFTNRRFGSHGFSFWAFSKHPLFDYDLKRLRVNSHAVGPVSLALFTSEGNILSLYKEHQIKVSLE